MLVRLKIIGRGGVGGMDNIDVDYAKKQRNSCDQYLHHLQNLWLN
jgi:hypothetical protein